MKDEEDFIKAISSKNRREQLEALRDLVAHELSVVRCEKCEAIRIRASDTAALVLRLQKILEELATLPDATSEQSPVDKLKSQTAAAGSASVTPMFGTRNAPRQQGGRRRG